MTLATIALVSCSKDETTGINQGCGIEFRPAIGKTTRAAETTTANLKEIHVVAFNEAGETRVLRCVQERSRPLNILDGSSEFLFLAL